MTGTQVSYLNYLKDKAHYERQDVEQRRFNTITTRENERSHRANEQLTGANLREQGRHNLIVEAISQGTLDEQRRSNLARESIQQATNEETAQHNRITESQQDTQFVVNKDIARGNNAATRYAANRSASATLQSAGINAAASKYSSDNSRAASQYSADAAAAASRYASDTNWKSAKFRGEIDKLKMISDAAIADKRNLTNKEINDAKLATEKAQGMLNRALEQDKISAENYRAQQANLNKLYTTLINGGASLGSSTIKGLFDVLG